MEEDLIITVDELADLASNMAEEGLFNERGAELLEQWFWDVKNTYIRVHIEDNGVFITPR